MVSKILIIAAHPDDETLGCGGTIARHCAEGAEVHLLFLTDGVGSRTRAIQGATDPKQRECAFHQALAILGVSKPNITALRFPDNALDGLPRLDIIREVEAIVLKVSPHIVYTHHAGDLNIDHRCAREAVLTACRPQPSASFEAIYSFEVPSSTGWAGDSPTAVFAPNVYVGIEPFLVKKMDALRAYNVEMRPFPHARSIEALEHLARFRGSQVGLPAAEAFKLERLIRA